ncbi:protein-tyrosine phosphatase-like protein [Cunninghamella echinulata]|nr:protein-tyrosine phosphatase-like protein [Cunninghamella echinulata]
MIPSTTYSAPLSSTKEGLPLRPLSANLSSPTSPLAQRRKRNNKNLSLCLTPSSSTQLDINQFIPPSTPFQPKQVKYYENGPICILPGIYLGDEYNATNDEQLKLYKINYIMNVATEVNHPRIDSFDKWDSNDDDQVLPCPTLSTSSSSTNSSSSSSLSLTASSSPTSSSSPSTENNKMIKYKKRSWHHQIMDNDQSSLKELHDAVMDIAFVKELNNKNILIHCQCGLARSASIIIAYVMYTRQLSMQMALLEVKKQAPHINPNFSLMYHLREYERWLMVKGWSKKSIQHKSSTETIKASNSSFVAKWKNFKYKSIYRHQWWRSTAATPTTTSNTSSSN